MATYHTTRVLIRWHCWTVGLMIANRPEEQLTSQEVAQWHWFAA